MVQSQAEERLGARALGLLQREVVERLCVLEPFGVSGGAEPVERGDGCGWRIHRLLPRFVTN